VNFRSPLIWDVFAVTTYFSVSLIYWYLGLVPDFASLRDRTAEGWRKRIYTVLSLGWRGAASHWVHYDKAYLLLAGLALAWSSAFTVSCLSTSPCPWCRAGT